MTQPQGTPADGALKVVWVPALANPAAPTVAELTAGSVVDISCYLTGDGWNPNTDEQVINDERLCSTQTFEQPGRFQDQLEVTYIFNQQLPASSPDNKAYTTLRRGTAGYIVARWGADYADPFAADDIVDVYPVKCGKQRKQPVEANSMMRTMQKLFVTAAVQEDVAVAA